MNLISSNKKKIKNLLCCYFCYVVVVLSIIRFNWILLLFLLYSIEFSNNLIFSFYLNRQIIAILNVNWNKRARQILFVCVFLLLVVSEWEKERRCCCCFFMIIIWFCCCWSKPHSYAGTIHKQNQVH